MKKLLVILIGCITLQACNKKDSDKSGSVVFWWSETTANGLQSDGATSLAFYVDGQLIGSSGTDVYHAQIPECNAPGSLTVSKNIGSSNEKQFTYSVKDQTGYVYWDGSVTISSGQCRQLELRW